MFVFEIGKYFKNKLKKQIYLGILTGNNRLRQEIRSGSKGDQLTHSFFSQY